MASSLVLPFGPHPDYHRLSQLHEGIAAETRKIPNTPQFQTGYEIRETLIELKNTLNGFEQRLDEKLNGLEQRLNGRLDGLGTRIEALDKRQEISDHNHSARLQNSLLQDASEDLSVFVHPITNTQIDGFPKTPQAIRDMSITELESLLSELDIQARGLKNEMQQRLRLHIGLRENPA